jgi:signal transduction histidine kinase
MCSGVLFAGGSMSEEETILYIEDDLNNRVLVSRILQAIGYQIFLAEDGMAGIRMAQEIKPDLILMDISMPGLDGYEAATKIKSLPGMTHTPIIAVTAHVMKGDRERALAVGCDGYLPKPIDVDALPDQIREFLGGRRDKVDEATERSYLREYSERLVEKLEEKINALTAANEQLKRSDVMKSRFIAIAAHELRTPITIIRGYVDILAGPSGPLPKDDPNARAMLDGISSGVQRLYEIVQDMLDVTQIEAGTLKLHSAPLRVDVIIDQVVASFLDGVTRRNLTVTLEPLGHLPVIWADNGRIQKIFANIIGNAIKYTPDGGRINVDGRLLGPEARTIVSVSNRLHGDSFVEFTVSDTGVGIDASEHEHIFERFYEVRDPRFHSTSKTEFMGGGAGLGLSIARGLAEAHGGWIWVESEGHDPKRCPGSRFHIVLPVGKQPGTR